MFCKKCGSNLTEGAAFCSVCGERVSAKPHNSESAELHASKDVRRHESDIDAAGPKSASSGNVKKPVSRKKLASIVTAIVLVVAVIAVVAVLASTGLSANQSERDPIVGDWTVAMDRQDAAVSFEMREDGSIALKGSLPGGKLLGIPMDEDSWNSLVEGLRWEKGPIEEEVQRCRLYFEGDVTNILGLDVVSEIEAKGFDIDAFLEGSTLQFWIPSSFPNSAAGEWGFRFCPASDGVNSLSGDIGISEVEMRINLNENGELVSWDPVITSEGAPPIDSWTLIGKWSEESNSNELSSEALSVRLTRENGDSVVEVIFSPNRGE